MIGILLGAFLVLLISEFFADLRVMNQPSQNPIYLDEKQSIEDRVADLLSRMTLEEKIGQMALVEKNSIEEVADISKYYLGALLSGSGAKPDINTVAGWQEMIASYQGEARKTRLGIPLLYGADAIHGHSHLPTATVFPHALGLGATNNSELVKAIAVATAEELFITGVNWSFSPNLDLPQDIRWGRVYEAFSDDPTLAAKLGVAHIEGLQNNVKSDDKEIFILATPKHYLGLGNMGWDTSLSDTYKIDQGVTPADEALLRSRYLPPFKAAVDAGALSMMVGLNVWGDEKMVFQKELLTDLLKDELGFKGFLVSDWYGVHHGSRIKIWDTVKAVNAGVDMFMLPFDYEQFVRHMKWANRLGFISDERIDDAVGRILYAKFALGLFDQHRESWAQTEIPNSEHQALARQAVSESIVLLKNKDDILPLSPNISRIKVAGSAAHNVGKQTGAWTIDWQGFQGNSLPGATSILEGIRASVSDETVIEYEPLGNFPIEKRKTPVGIAVVGENPYAEGFGDTEFPIIYQEDLVAIQNLQLTCDKVIVVIVSGRPLLIEREIKSWDALLAAWLLGAEGAGVADVLFGYKPFTGTLPLPWPRSAEQLPISPEGESADGTPVLFPRGFGLVD